MVKGGVARQRRQRPAPSWLHRKVRRDGRSACVRIYAHAVLRYSARTGFLDLQGGELVKAASQLRLRRRCQQWTVTGFLARWEEVQHWRRLSRAK